MEGDNNPFKAPTAQVADFGGQGTQAGDFIPEGRRVPAGNAIGWLAGGWELFKQAPGIWIGMIIIWSVIFTVLLMLSAIPAVTLLAYPVCYMLAPVLMGGFMLGCRALDDGDELTVGYLFAGFSNHFGNLLLVGLLYLVGAIAIGFLMMVLIGGSFMTAFAGGQVSPWAVLLPVLLGAALSIPLAMAVWYAPALVVLNEVAPFEAMKASFFTSIRNFVPFLLYGLVVFVLAIVATLPIMLGWLVLAPVLVASVYASYRDMFYES
jgi:uncharacterized membrane protein